MSLLPSLLLALGCGPDEVDPPTLCIYCPLAEIHPAIVRDRWYGDQRQYALSQPPLLDPWEMEVHASVWIPETNPSPPDPDPQGERQVLLMLQVCEDPWPDCDVRYDRRGNTLELLNDLVLEHDESLRATYYDRSIIEAQ